MFDLSKTFLLDGAMGTVLQSRGLAGLGESYNLSNPEAIGRIHSDYIAAGADIIETNSFSANRISLAPHGLSEKAGQFAYEAAKIARRAADDAHGKVLVAGSMGPTTKSLSVASDASKPWFREVGFDEMAAAYREQIDALTRGGADFLLLETCIDALNAKAAIHSYIELGAKIPLAISVTVSSRSGRTLSGQTLRAFYESVRHASPVAFGLNCSDGAAGLRPLIKEVAGFAECATICYPNAGLPNEMGGYDETPEEMAAAIMDIVRDGSANIVGGCCGTTPSHIAAIRAVLPGDSGRSGIQRGEGLAASGLEAVEVDSKRFNFTNIGERTNVAGSRKFARLIAEARIDEALEVAAAQIEAGARIIDINMDDAMLDSAAEMKKFVLSVQSAPQVARAALMIDSSDWRTILEGLKSAQGKCIVNSLSLKDGEEIFLEKAEQAKRLGAALVVMAFDENGQATDFARKIEIAERAYRLLTERGWKPEDIIFDAGILSVATGEPGDRRYAVDFLDAVRWIKRNLPGMLTSGGVSNLSFALRGNNPMREAMHSVFLYHAVRAGLDMAIVNPGALQPYTEIEPQLRDTIEDVLMDRSEGASEKLMELASGVRASDCRAETSSSVPTDVREILVKGSPEGLEDALRAEVAACGSPAAVIEGALMEGMERVGKLFEEGKMFLPQVIKSAKIMKQAVELLTPEMGVKAGEVSDGRPLIVIATVKGDIHDIGKNITATVLGCNGFRVKDLGVDVDSGTIIGEAVRLGASVICVSGLITPSLKRMEEICEALSGRGLDLPLLVGGATTSEVHTAVKLATLYPHVFHCSDASATSVLSRRLLSSREECETALHEAQKRICELYTKGRRAEKPSDGGKLFGYLEPEGFFPEALENIPVCEIPVRKLTELLDFDTFLAIWKIKAADREKPEVQKLLAEARERLSGLQCSVRCALHWSSFPNCDAPCVGLFAAAVHHTGCSCCHEEDYLERTLELALADAAAQWLENKLCVPEGYRLIRPAVGYPSCPDHSLKAGILEMIPDSEKLGISLTESFAMSPEGSVCGFFLVHKNARYL